MSDFSHRTGRRTDLLVFMNLGYNYNFIHTKNKKFVKKGKSLPITNPELISSLNKQMFSHLHLQQTD